ncbi:Rne/Rng family ribonuclease [Rhodobacteraceae bacterium LMO-12]|nr:Rne/Rng family ribonuclease [Rhodobacteraceae bacterium LMO-JJ12]
MAKKMLIDATHAEETRVVVVDGNKVEEFDFESENKRQLAGNIYLAKVTRVEPSLQAAFVDYGGNRHGFLAFSEIHPDYYQIPIADREALMEEERAYAEAQHASEDDDEKKSGRSRRRRSRSKAADVKTDDAVETRELSGSEIDGMETIEFGDDEADALEGHSPMDLVAETPVEEPDTSHADTDDDDDHGDDTPDAASKDETIESVADDDAVEDIRPPRKPRPRRYKIQEVIKVRQILLVQVVKEERGNKGAALTTYLSLAGRYCVLMPNTARGGGISRKITNAVDRKKLKEIANDIDVPKGAGLIVRTAGAKRTKTEIKRDYEYLQRLWEQIRELTLKSIAPAKIYEEGDLIKRSIRDLYSREIDEVLVEGERGYRIAKDFMKMIMPSHAKNVKLYQETMPLFARFQVESYLSSMFNPTVQLKSGGYIVIGVTEALVAIDVNSGRATKEGSIEDTATKTNLEAAEEVARQLRLRDLAGLIVIDFIDMDERKNNAAVEKRIKDKLKTDRARIQVGRISGFGLMEMSRQRLRPGMIEATTQPCPSCHGTGLIRSDDNLALSILRQIEEEGTRRRSREVLVKCPVGIANFLMNQKREHVAQIEVRYGISVRIEGDPMLISPDFALEKFKTATRAVPEMVVPVVSAESSLMAEIDNDSDDASDDDTDDDVVEANGNGNGNGDGDEDTKPRSKRRRRRRRKKPSHNNDGDEGQDNGADASESGKADSGDDAPAHAEPVAAQATASEVTVQAGADEQQAEKEKPKPRSRSRRKKTDDADAAGEVTAKAEAAPDAGADATAEGKPKPRSRVRSRKAVEEPEAEVASADAEVAGEKPAPKKRASRAKPKKDAEAVAEAGSADDAKAAEEKPKTRSRTSRAKTNGTEPAEAKPKAAPKAAKPEVEAEVTPDAQSEAPPKASAEVVAEVAPEPEAPVAAPVEAAVEAPKKKTKRMGWWSLGKG